MNGIFVGLGSNMGDRERTIRRALAQLDRLPGTELLRVSSLYDTDPVGVLDQPDFLNAVAEIESTLSPRELLWHFRLIERRLGRTNERKWGPRTLDLDLLLYGPEVFEEEALIVPHPELPHRAFVLIPLCELAPTLVHPVLHSSIRELLRACGEIESVRSLGRFWYQDVK